MRKVLAFLVSMMVAISLCAVMNCQDVHAASADTVSNSFYKYELLGDGTYKVELTDAFKNQLNKSSGGLLTGTDAQGKRVTWTTGKALPNPDPSGMYNGKKVTSMENMFCDDYNPLSNLTSLNLSNFNTSNVTNMEGMFCKCLGLKSLDISSFNTSKVTDMSSMFSWCWELKSLDISSFNTSKVTDMSFMFSWCWELNPLDVGNFNTSHVIDMSNMFLHCQKLKSLNLRNFDTSKVTAMNNMFYDCESLTTLDVSSFNTSKVTDMVYLTGECYNLKSLDLSNFDVSAVGNESLAGMFRHVAKNTSKTPIIGYAKDQATASRFNDSNITEIDTSKIRFVAKESHSRIYGATRYETAFKTADALKSKMGGEQFNAAVVAYGENFPDALSGTYLANVKGAPILLANARNAQSEANVSAYIQRNVKKGSTVYILGGQGLVSSRFADKVKQQGYTVKRLWGNDRYATNIKILAEAGVKSGQDLIVCTGNNYPDALSTAALGKPILLVDNQVTAQQQSMIQRAKFKNIYIIGGTAAISDRIKNSISQSAKRISGSDRYSTSVAIAKQFYKNPTTVVLAYGQNFPDGLAGGALAYKAKAPLLLADSNPTTDKKIASYVDSTQINNMYVLGGPGLISNNAAESILRYDK